MLGASNTERVPPDVLVELGLGRVGAQVRLRQLTVAVVEGGCGPGSAAPEEPGDGGILVVVARERQRLVAQEVLGVAASVLRVHPKECHPPLVPAREPLEERELEAARAA